VYWYSIQKECCVLVLNSDEGRRNKEKDHHECVMTKSDNEACVDKGVQGVTNG
jgi:hypothetical protein